MRISDWSSDLVSSVRGEKTFVGTSGRVFPWGFRATTLLRAWLARLSDLGVELRTRHTWTGGDAAGHRVLTETAGEEVVDAADACVLALGGASWPRTGSDGSWVPVLDDQGIAVTPLRPANCGFVVAWSDLFRERFAGEPLKDVSLHHQGSAARGDVVVVDKIGRAHV